MMVGCVSVNPCATGTPGSGTPGATWYSGNGAPSNSIGNVNDFYLDTSSGDVYQKLAGSWVFQLNIMGQPGALDSIYELEALVSIDFGRAIYVTNTGKLDLAYATSLPYSQVVGLAIETVTQGFACKYKTEGKIFLSDWTLIIGTALLSIGAEYFLSELLPGMLGTVLPSSGYVISVGRAMTTNVLDIEISAPIQL